MQDSLLRVLHGVRLWSGHGYAQEEYAMKRERERERERGLISSEAYGVYGDTIYETANVDASSCCCNVDCQLD